jgi:hypothetical protein
MDKARLLGSYAKSDAARGVVNPLPGQNSTDGPDPTPPPQSEYQTLLSP